MPREWIKSSLKTISKQKAATKCCCYDESALPRAIADTNIVRKQTEVTRDSFCFSSHSAPAGLDISRANRMFFPQPSVEADISSYSFAPVPSRAQGECAPGNDVL